MKRILAVGLLAALAVLGPARAANTPAATVGGVTNPGGPPFAPSQPAVLTRSNDTTQYTVNTAVCASKSATCVPLQLQFARNGGPNTGIPTRVLLWKSGSTTTSATFTIWFYSAPPKVTNIDDNSAYTGPFAADLTAGIYLGYATCGTANTGSDSYVFYECSLMSNNPAFGATLQIVYAMIEVTGTWTPTAQEKLGVSLGGLLD